MSISAVQTQPIQNYVIVRDGATYYVALNGVYLTTRSGNVRVFSSRSSARKHITRERRGIFS